MPVEKLEGSVKATRDGNFVLLNQSGLPGAPLLAAPKVGLLILIRDEASEPHAPTR
jgi:hypothetical protein